jgi:pilus assembly protein CpaC
MTHSRTFLRLGSIGAALVVAASAGPVRAQPSRNTIPAPVLAVGGNEGSTARRVDLTMGRSLVIDLPRDAKEVFVANPKVANAVVRSTRKVFVIGMENGATSIFIMDAEGRQITALDVTVATNLNLGELSQILMRSIPGGRFDLRSAGN